MTRGNVVARLMLAPLLLLSNQIRIAAQDQKRPLLFDGLLVDDSGRPVPGAQIQFWQTDATHGLYNFPLSAVGSLLDPTFQYFGTETTDDDGKFAFKTYKPAAYTTRPPHIHFKVWVGGNDVLTSQFYFAEDDSGRPASLQLDLEEGIDDEGDAAFLSSKTIAIDLGGGGTTPLTPTQSEGPFYPVVDFFNLDGDLTVVDVVQDASGSTIGGDGGEVSPSPGPTNTNTIVGVDVEQDGLVAAGQNNGETDASSAGSVLSGVPLSMITLCFFVF